MSDLPDARRIAAATIATAAGAATLLLGQALVATYRTYLPSDSAPPVDGTYGEAQDPPVRLVLLGDSTGAGVGARSTEETVGAYLGRALARETHRRVAVTSVAVAGSRAGDLGPQVSRALLSEPDVAVVLIGANDATHVTPLREVTSGLYDALTRLRGAGVPVVVGTCPDMGARSFMRPLRELVAWEGRRIARAEAIAAHEADAAVVLLHEICGPKFRADPSTMSVDDFHPSGKGYSLWAEALLPAVRDAVQSLTRR